MFTEVFFFFATFLLSIAILKSVFRKQKSGRVYPPSLPSIPILGSLPFLISAGGHLPKFFLKKSEELGPIFTLKIGSKRQCLVLNSLESIEDALVKKSSTFSGRQIFFQETYSGNFDRKGIIAGNFNAYWKYHQKLSLSILREFGFGNKNTMESRISQEVVETIKFIKATNGRAFDPKNLTLQTSANILHQILFAQRIPYSNNLNEYFQTGTDVNECLSLSIDAAPLLRFFPYFRQTVTKSTRLYRQLIRFIEGFVNDVKSGDREECFVSKYLEKEGTKCDIEQLFYIIRDISIAGMDTTATTVLWSLLFLANHQNIQKKLQLEMDEEVPRSRLPSFEDGQKLPHLEAFILEMQRIKPLVPLSVPHQTLNDIEISGYFVPAGTMVMPNLYAVHMDPKCWKDPEEFRPERFLDEDNKIINKERCIPFSLGRRSCLGEVLARQELFQIVSGLVQNFVILPLENQTRIDEKEDAGAIMRPASKFQVRMIYRTE